MFPLNRARAGSSIRLRALTCGAPGAYANRTGNGNGAAKSGCRKGHPCFKVVSNPALTWSISVPADAARIHGIGQTRGVLGCNVGRAVGQLKRPRKTQRQESWFLMTSRWRVLFLARILDLTNLIQLYDNMIWIVAFHPLLFTTQRPPKHLPPLFRGLPN